eukprot:256871-Pleurochrysis_carterae.AAC.2
MHCADCVAQPEMKEVMVTHGGPGYDSLIRAALHEARGGVCARVSRVTSQFRAVRLAGDALARRCVRDMSLEQARCVPRDWQRACERRWLRSTLACSV